jgi:hypothetical protein
MKIYRFTILHAEVQPDNRKTCDLFLGEKVLKANLT